MEKTKFVQDLHAKTFEARRRNIENSKFLDAELRRKSERNYRIHNFLRTDVPAAAILVMEEIVEEIQKKVDSGDLHYAWKPTNYWGFPNLKDLQKEIILKARCLGLDVLVIKDDNCSDEGKCDNSCQKTCQSRPLSEIIISW